MNTVLRTCAIVSVLAVIGGAFYVMTIPDSGSSVSVGENEAADESPKTALRYVFDAFHLSFEYPDTYVLSERDGSGEAERGHHMISLIDKVAASNIPEGGEGPTAITIDIYQNRLDRLSLESWIHTNAESGFKQSVDGVLSSSTISGVPAISYTWDGLYRGESVVFMHRERIYKVSVTYLTPSDQIRADFERVLASIGLN